MQRGHFDAVAERLAAELGADGVFIAVIGGKSAETGEIQVNGASFSGAPHAAGRIAHILNQIAPRLVQDAGCALAEGDRRQAQLN